MPSLRLATCLAALALGGCNTPDIPTEIASVFVEAMPSASSAMKQEVRLPVSQIAIMVMSRPLVPAEEILATEPITAGETDLRQDYLAVQLDRRAATDVMQYSQEGYGKKLVLVVNDTAVGIMPINAPINDGILYFHVEKKGLTNREAIIDLSLRLNISALKLRKIKEAERK